MLNSTAGLVERVVLLGAPISIEDEKWEVARKVPRSCLTVYKKSTNQSINFLEFLAIYSLFLSVLK